jgi:hypothetical protein
MIKWGQENKKEQRRTEQFYNSAILRGQEGRVKSATLSTTQADKGEASEGRQEEL